MAQTSGATNAQVFPYIQGKSLLGRKADVFEKRRLGSSSSEPEARVAVLDPKNWRHTSSRLDRYYRATAQALAAAPVLSMAGPDGTKVGTSVNLTMGHIMNSSTNYVAICAPQMLRALGHLQGALGHLPLSIF